MSEYWVSQAKYYCKVCNCYIADNKPSRQHHDNGAKHKEKVELLMKQKRQEKLHGARSESELKQQLADIEKAAKEAIAVDRTEQDGFFYQNSGVRPRAPPPPPAPRPPGFPQPKAGDRDEDAELLEEDDGTGMYTVKGQTYLQGKVHEDKIRSGMPCEVFVEALDEWFAGSITARHETPIPHTALFLLTFDVEYAVTGQAAAEDTVVRDMGVKSDRIRLLAAADGTLPGYEAPAGSGIVASKPVVLNENTGLGMWQTVAVREVDEEALLEERLQAELAREAMLRGKSSDDHGTSGTSGKAAKQHAGAGAGADADNYHDDSAMSAYDPYGRHSQIYKGVRLTEDTDHKEYIESIAQGASVSFKKRKTATGGASSTPTAAPTASNSAADTGATVVKTEAKEHCVDASAGGGTSSMGQQSAAALSGVSSAGAPPDTKPVVVSMKIGNMQGGGAKRKFRVREPSPP